jgi:hypothetical protein
MAGFHNFAMNRKRPVFALFTFTLVLGFLMVAGCGGSTGEEDVPFEEIAYSPTIIRSDLDMREAALQFQLDSAANPKEVYQRTLMQHQGFLTALLVPDAGPGDSAVVADSALPDIVHYFFGDSATWKLLDSLLIRYPESDDLRDLLEKPLKRYHYYFPAEPQRKVYTFLSGYEHTGAGTIDQIFLNDEYIGIGLHYFMGQDFGWYPPDVPVYMRRRFQRAYIPSIVAEELVKLQLPNVMMDKQPTLLDMMVIEGIKMEIRHKLIPEVPDSVLLSYTQDQMEWANYYEARTYKEILPDLYSSDVLIHRRYIQESPFTNTLSRESAPRLGQFIGWKIVRAYLRGHSDVTPADLVQMHDYNLLFQEANYRPPREGESAD